MLKREILQSNGREAGEVATLTPSSAGQQPSWPPPSLSAGPGPGQTGPWVRGSGDGKKEKTCS